MRKYKSKKRNTDRRENKDEDGGKYNADNEKSNRYKHRQTCVSSYLCGLQQQLNSVKFREVFERLKSRYSIFDLYPTIESLCTLLKPGSKKYAHKDEVMAILLVEFRKDNIVYPLINIMFWNSLCRLYKWRSFSVADKESLWERIQWDFYHTVVNHNLERLPRKIDVNIFLNTRKKVIAWEKENLRYKDALRELESLHKAGLSGNDLEGSNIYPEEMEAYLLDKVYRKVITPVQYDLILETVVYRRMSIKDWAEKKDISYTTARTLKFRAEKAVRQFEEQGHDKQVKKA